MIFTSIHMSTLRGPGPHINAQECTTDQHNKPLSEQKTGLGNARTLHRILVHGQLRLKNQDAGHMMPAAGSTSHSSARLGARLWSLDTSSSSSLGLGWDLDENTSHRILQNQRGRMFPINRHSKLIALTKEDPTRKKLPTRT